MNHKNTGLKLEPIVLGEHFILGSSVSLGGGEILQPDGQWDEYLPTKDEFQTLTDRDPLACTLFGTTNAIEILIRRVYGTERNYSDRWLAKATDTDKKGGNDPHAVAEFIRKNGVVEESVWPLKGIKTFAEFYANFPQNLYQLALSFISEFAFGHEWVPTYQVNIKEAQAALMEGLKYSPLGVSVYAWERRQDGIYYKPKNAPGDTHFPVCYGYEEGKYWKILDSYDQPLKRYTWDSIFGVAKRYTLDRQVINEGAFATFLKWLKALVLGTPKPPETPPVTPQEPITEPQTPPAPPTPSPAPTPSKLQTFCLAIKQHEGWFPGSRSQKNNNPGNCRFSSQGYLPIYGHVGKDPQSFAIFKDYATGYLYLQNLVKSKISVNPKQSFYAFFEVYAPSFENDSKHYAEVVAKACGVSPSDPVSKIL